MVDSTQKQNNANKQSKLTQSTSTTYIFFGYEIISTCHCVVIQRQRDRGDRERPDEGRRQDRRSDDPNNPEGDGRRRGRPEDYTASPDDEENRRRRGPRHRPDDHTEDPPLEPPIPGIAGNRPDDEIPARPPLGEEPQRGPEDRTESPNTDGEGDRGRGGRRDGERGRFGTERRRRRD